MNKRLIDNLVKLAMILILGASVWPLVLGAGQHCSDYAPDGQCTKQVGWLECP